MPTHNVHPSPFRSLADLVEEHYVLEDRATAYAQTIRDHGAELDALLPDRSAANARLHELVPDKHLSIREPSSAARDLAPPVSHAGGFALVEQRTDGVAVVAIRPFFAGPEIALPHLRAVATLCREARSLVLDLRQCGGGDTDTAALIHGWLLGPEPVVLGRFERRGMPSVEYVSDVSVGGHFGGPVAVLVSGRTFSGGEDLAYVQQAVGRATVFGERTGGGAHPVEHFPLPGGVVCQIPVARSVIAATGSNWEGVGVTPDEPCKAAQAPALAVGSLPID